MENASKALIIAGAILLSIAIIGIGMYVYNSVSGTISDAADMSSEQIMAYNQTFLTYEGTSVRGSVVKTLCGVVRNHNLSAEDETDKVGMQTGTAPADGIFSASSLSDSYTSVSAINTLSNSINSGSTYTVEFGYDPNTGYVTMVYINEN